MERTLGRLLRRPARWVVGLALAAVVFAFSVGCYGAFPLTHAIYKANGKITDEKVVHTILFWVFVILPVYELSMLGDAIIFNLYEFWTGDELIKVSQATPDGGAWTLAPESGGRDAVLIRTDRRGRVVTRARFVRAGEGRFDVRDQDDRIAGHVRITPEGTCVLMDRAGSVVGTIGGQTALAAAR
jgi:hypothetical protein